MEKTIKVDICVIGAGAGGLSVAAGASQMGASVALIEAGKMGGDCLNYGCVPSKSLLAAAKAAHRFQQASCFGIQPVKPQVDFAKVMQHVQDVIHTISVKDSVERFSKLGVRVFQSCGEFVDTHTVKVAETVIKARRFVIATGSSPAIPPIPGLDRVPYYTNESIFNLKEKPDHLIIIGGGPIGCELGQAFLLLGTKITLLEAFTILPHDEPDLVAQLRERLVTEGLKIQEHSKIVQISQHSETIQVTLEKEGGQQNITGSHLLVATGRKANSQHLNLEAAGIECSTKGILVDHHLRTTNPHVYAIGDVSGGFQFTHIANYHASIVIRNILFRIPAKVDYRTIPWVTYTDPELAHVGLTKEQALKQGHKINELTLPLSENDRAQAEHETTGEIKIIVDKKGYILGVSLLGAQAGELLLPWVLMIQKKLKIKDMATIIAPYPTLGEISKLAAGEYYKPILFSSGMKRWVKFLQWFG